MMSQTLSWYLATLGGSRQRHLALLVRHGHGDFFWYQDAAGLFRVFRIGGSAVALALPDPQVCCELLNRGENMRRIVSMLAAIITALIMLAVFDSAARSDEQAQLLQGTRNCLAVLTKKLVAQEVAQRPSNVLTATSRRAPMPFVTEVILRSDSNPFVEGH
jgi:hypothetical protein